eukprot:TRINITY_DN487_c0_g1_i1.p1 TRINITY_DN487_c0_g1~~TRINITY_DN487_c0_g1_i1.p1  ORF type:complete len:171 (-),score=18.25 TRINITY_DN487_c0_g1_i1:150-662(-)
MRLSKHVFFSFLFSFFMFFVSLNEMPTHPACCCSSSSLCVVVIFPSFKSEGWSTQNWDPPQSTPFLLSSFFIFADSSFERRSRHHSKQPIGKQLPLARREVDGILKQVSCDVLLLLFVGLFLFFFYFIFFSQMMISLSYSLSYKKEKNSKKKKKKRKEKEKRIEGRKVDI